MPNTTALKKVDYLIIGHITRDLIPNGERIGGTAAYAALTARALGLRVGIVTSLPNEMLETANLPADIQIVNQPAETATTFKNTETETGRRQRLHAQANEISFAAVPQIWHRTPIIHLAPVVRELGETIGNHLSPTLLGVTPQGWLRQWDADGNISPRKWSEMEPSLKQVGAAVLSVEDVQDDEELIEEMSIHCRVLAITEASEGARLYWNGDLRRFRAPKVDEIDPVGAGDIFAAAFFIRLYTTRDPWEAARFANCIAAGSVTWHGLESIPTPEEIQSCQMEVL
jgi:hypothetical protein